MLVDAAQFYVSCQRVFQASLHNKPTIVLSSNDGCIIALDKSAKSLGLQRGQPYFKCRQIIRKHDVQVFSSNFPLYREMSARMMTVLAELSPRLECYSIDEAFGDLTDMQIDDLTEFGHTVRARVYQLCGLHVTVAFAATKGQTKLAGELLRQDERYQDVLDLTRFTPDQMDAALSQIAIEDVWGVGAKYARFLRNYNIQTAKDLRDADERWVKKYLTVVGARIQLELRGTSCLPLEEKQPPRQQLINAKSFGSETSRLPELEEAVASYVARTAEKLREQDSQVSRITVFVRTNPFDTDAPQYSNSFTIDLAHPTAFTPELIKQAVKGLHAMYRPNFSYKKIGVVFSRVTPMQVVQPDLFGEASLYEFYRQARLCAVIDAINRIWGRDTIIFAAQGFERSWRMRQSFLSGHYLSRWDELLTI